MSEKYGRKPILLAGMSIYIVASVMCGFSQQAEQLIFSRIFQAFGGSAATAVATAMVKDLYNGHRRERVIAFVMSIMTFLAVSAYIYINGFDLNGRQYSYFLAFNAFFSMTGPMLYLRLSRHFKSRTIISVIFFVFIFCGIAVSTIGHLSPWAFVLSSALTTLSVTVLRVPGTNFLLEQQQNDTGSVSALINFFGIRENNLSIVLTWMIGQIDVDFFCYWALICEIWQLRIIIPMAEHSEAEIVMDIKNICYWNFLTGNPFDNLSR